MVGRQNYNNSPSRVAIAFFDIPVKNRLIQRQLAFERYHTPQSAAAEAAATTAGLDNSFALGEKDPYVAEPEPGSNWEVFLAEGFSRSLVPGRGGKVAITKLYLKPIL